MKSCYTCVHRQQQYRMDAVIDECRRFPPDHAGFPARPPGSCACGEHSYREGWWARTWPAFKARMADTFNELKKLAKEM